MDNIHGLPGGGNFALTASESFNNLSALAGYEVLIWCDEQQLLFSFAPTGTTTGTLVTGAQAASLTALVADETGAGVKVARLVLTQNTVLVAKTATSTGTLRVKPIRKWS